MKGVPDSFSQSRIAFNAAALGYYPPLERVEQYVQSHMREHVTLGIAASVARLERKYFSAFFHSKVGVTFRDWNAILRVQRAMDIMRVRRSPVLRVAFAVGFNNVRSFERTFKKLTGITPQAFRAAVERDSRFLSQESRIPARR